MTLTPAAILLAASFAVFGQINASSASRPVSLGMQEREGVLNLTLQNPFKRAIGGYVIGVWALNEENIPRRVCTLQPNDISARHQEITIAVPKTCTIPRNPDGGLRLFTVKLSTINVDGHVINYGTMPVSGTPAK